METNTPRIYRERTVVYLDPAILRDMKRVKAETDKPIGHLIEENWKETSRRRRRRRPAMTAAHAAG